MKNIIVNGKPCTLTRFRGSTLAPGTLIGQIDGRRVYRVLCFDGDDVIARNVRHGSIIEAFQRQEVLEEFGLVQAV